MDEQREIERGRLPLAALVDRLAGGARRDEVFVRRFSAWFARHAPHLHLSPVDALGLVDVVLTFRMKRVLTLVATGTRPDFPGEVTVHFHEVDFPFLEVIVDRDPRPDPYEVCTLDYAVEGRPAELSEAVSVEGRALPAGVRGRAVVATTVGETRHVRIVLDGEPDAPINVAPESLHWLDELPDPGRPSGGGGPKPN